MTTSQTLNPALKSLSEELGDRIIKAHHEGLSGSDLAFVALHVAAGACRAASVDDQVASQMFVAMLAKASQESPR